MAEGWGVSTFLPSGSVTMILEEVRLFGRIKEGFFFAYWGFVVRAG